MCYEFNSEVPLHLLCIMSGYTVIVHWYQTPTLKSALRRLYSNMKINVRLLRGHLYVKLISIQHIMHFFISSKRQYSVDSWELNKACNLFTRLYVNSNVLLILY